MSSRSRCLDRMGFLHTGCIHSDNPVDPAVLSPGKQSHTQSVLFYYRHNIVLLETQRFLLLSFPARFSALQALSDGLLSAFPRQVPVLSALRETDRLSSSHRVSLPAHLLSAHILPVQGKSKSLPANVSSPVVLASHLLSARYPLLDKMLL